MLVSVVVVSGCCSGFLFGGDVLAEVGRGSVTGSSPGFRVSGVVVSPSFVVISVGVCWCFVVFLRFCAAGAVLFPPHRFIFLCVLVHLSPILQPPGELKNLQKSAVTGRLRESRRSREDLSLLRGERSR